MFWNSFELVLNFTNNIIVTSSAADAKTNKAVNTRANDIFMLIFLKQRVLDFIMIGTTKTAVGIYK